MARICTELIVQMYTAAVIAGTTAANSCTGNDFAISGDARIFSGAQGIQGPFQSEPTLSGNGWSVTVGGGNGANTVAFGTVTVCFANPGPKPHHFFYIYDKSIFISPFNQCVF